MPRVTPAAGGAEYRRNFPVISDPACLTAPRQPLVAAAALDHVLALALLCNMVGPAMGEALPTGDEGAPRRKGRFVFHPTGPGPMPRPRGITAILPRCQDGCYMPSDFIMSSDMPDMSSGID